MRDGFKGNVYFTDRQPVSAQTLTEAGWAGAANKSETDAVFAQQVAVSDDKGVKHELLVTPVLPDGSVLSPDELNSYISEVLQGSDNFLGADNREVVIAVDVDPEGEAARKLQELQELFYAAKPPMDYDAYQQYVKANEQYLQLANNIAERNRKEQEKQSREHQKEVDRMRDFMLPDEKKEREYNADLEILQEVYEQELTLAGDNAERKLEIEEAYQIARLALAKKYGQMSLSGMQGAVASSAEWLKSDGGKALLGTMSTLSSGMSEIFSQVTSMMEADLEIQTAAIEKRYEKELSLAEGNTYKTKKLEEQKEKDIAKAKQEANRKSFAMQVIQAVAQTATNALNAYGSAAAIPVTGYILAPIAASMAVAAGMLQIAAIKQQQQASEAQGYSEGGFTPDGAVDEVTGVVHAGEWVASQKLTKNPNTRPLLEALDYAQRTNTVGSLTAADVSRSITAPILLASQQQAQPTIITNNTYTSVAENRELSTTIRELKDRLSEPFVTVNTVSGDYGMQRAQEAYERLIRNKSPKSRK
jgi:hypothetical protein